MAEKTNWIEIAKDILGKAKEPLHINEIANRALVAGYIKGDLETITRNMNASLANSVKKPKISPFRKIKNKNGKSFKKGFYELKPIKKAQTQTLITPKPQVNTQYVGKAGEMAVFSELLFYGYNASIMSVDDGIDLVATKEGRFFFIQVKTALSNDNKTPNFTIKKDFFIRYDKSETFYILVIRNFDKKGYSNLYFVIPNHTIRKNDLRWNH
ncbi:group I intron-associated PD-(D/E)XK endonuclease [Helicobacter sp.]|uniref:group I intron-associated PD-(D/E)XK endonuclease n=1 Tax=Helicobacter sp. TaxID=218 RepID=UPI0025C10B6D|nr:group I intron-associated PD-(D/E)XK endonuclease [Helicobacter sp.]MCI5969130.1 group I intron-associated PD-(D/E)XK endonuclease [Helicobacter sp.]MDY2584705.1 group I intron-associated PD-(D/E)XK endonuclease [Helicobacter sp.]